MGDVAKECRNFAQGCRGSMWQSRDETIRLMDEAADRIEALEAERDGLANQALHVALGHSTGKHNIDDAIRLLSDLASAALKGGDA